ncbi:hypothetical protein K9857_29385, partial [Pseudomonas sp. REP124]|uniref:hypothetical protein n=1 Tax=Pseudomonas sp. REP124 TaxID=2875731 RepID=UPI001CCCACAB
RLTLPLREQARSHKCDVSITKMVNDPTTVGAEFARDERETTTGHQAASVIVNDHRGQARSHRLYVDCKKW